MRDAAKIYHYSPLSVSNHVKSKENSIKQPIMHHADADVDRQLLTLGEKAALERHIYQYYGLGLVLTTPLFRGFVNKLLKAKGSDKTVGKKWHLRFYKRHPNMETKYSRPMERARVINENADNYIKWFRRVFVTILKWDIELADTWNMDELRVGIVKTLNKVEV
jgi:hypothetical protein